MKSAVRQLNFSEINNLNHQFPLVVLCENFLSPENVGMTFRLGDAMGVRHLYLTGSTPTPPNRKLQKAARSAHKKVPYTYDLDTCKVLQQLRDSGYTLIGLEITNQSQDIRTFDFAKLEKIALIAGAERFGISENTLGLLDATVHVPMYGKGSSMNVVTALAVGLYEIVRQLG